MGEVLPAPRREMGTDEIRFMSPQIAQRLVDVVVVVVSSCCPRHHPGLRRRVVVVVVSSLSSRRRLLRWAF